MVTVRRGCEWTPFCVVRETNRAFITSHCLRVRDWVRCGSCHDQQVSDRKRRNPVWRIDEAARGTDDASPRRPWNGIETSVANGAFPVGWGGNDCSLRQRNNRLFRWEGGYRSFDQQPQSSIIANGLCACKYSGGPAEGRNRRSQTGLSVSLRVLRAPRLRFGQRDRATRGHSFTCSDICRPPCSIFVRRHRILTFGILAIRFSEIPFQIRNTPTATRSRPAAAAHLARTPGTMDADVVDDLPLGDVEAVTDCVVELHAVILQTAGGPRHQPPLPYDQCSTRSMVSSTAE
mgnify:CR=1 FL=1